MDSVSSVHIGAYAMKKPIPTRAASRRQENKVAKLLGGKVQPNSGATDYYKGDVTTDEMLLE